MIIFRRCYFVTPGVGNRIIVPTPHVCVFVVEHVNFLIDTCQAGQVGYIRHRPVVYALGVGASCLLQVCPGTKRELSLFATLFESDDPPMTKPGINQSAGELKV